MSTPASPTGTATPAVAFDHLFKIVLVGDSGMFPFCCCIKYIDNHYILPFLDPTIHSNNNNDIF
jgi:hypothetical protein